MMEQTAFMQLHEEINSPANVDPRTKLDKIRKALEDAVQNGSLQVVDQKEIDLIIAYRKWSQSPQRATGLFHFKVI